MTDWVGWHAAYDDPSSPLSRRLAVVRRRLSDALDDLADVRPCSVLSLCAGDGRDLVPVLAGRRERTVTALLVERDRELAGRARRAVQTASVDRVEVRCADAGDRSSFEDVVPVDVMLLCGVLGNLDPDAVPQLIAALPQLLTPGGRVVWTRGGSTPDRRPDVRRWFAECGLPELSFDGAPEPFGVGVNERPTAGPTLAAAPVGRLFSFVER